MEEVLKAAATQTPSLVVLVVVVWFFLRALKDQRDSAVVERKELLDRLNLFHGDHLTARTEMQQVLKDVAEAITKISVAVASCPLKKP